MLSKSIPVLVGALLVSVVGVAEPLPELDCLVEPNLVVDVGSPEHGVVETIAVDRSDTVSANDVLAKLESSEQAADVRKARARVNMGAEIEARKATLALAERKQERMRDLYASEAISSQQRDEVETELKMAQMQLQQARDAAKLARIELDSANADLNRRTIRSPISGVIVERFVAPGEYVNEKPLLRVAQMNPLRIETIAPAALFGKIKPGMQANIIAETYGDQALDAEITIVDRLIDPASGTFGIRLELPNPNLTIPSGLNCRLRILPEQRVAAVTEPKPVAIVPATAEAKPGMKPVPVAELEPPAPTANEQAGDKAVTATEPVSLAKAPVTLAKAVEAKPETKPVAVAQLETAEPEIKQANDEVATPVQPALLANTSVTPATTAEAKPETNPAPAAVLEPAVLKTKAEANDTVATATPPISLACTTLGPFSSDDQLETLLVTLGADAREVGRRGENDEQTKGFFVATRPLATLAAAQTLSKKLKNYGMTGLAVLPEGPTGGRVSLGLFAKHIDAKTRQHKLTLLGIETEVLPNRMKTRELWLDVEMPAARLQQAPWKSVVPQVKAADCAPSLYVMAETAGSAKNAQ